MARTTSDSAALGFSQTTSNSDQSGCALTADVTRIWFCWPLLPPSRFLMNRFKAANISSRRCLALDTASVRCVEACSVACLRDSPALDIL